MVYRLSPTFQQDPGLPWCAWSAWRYSPHDCSSQTPPWVPSWWSLTAENDNPCKIKSIIWVNFSHRDLIRLSLPPKQTNKQNKEKSRWFTHMVRRSCRLCLRLAILSASNVGLDLFVFINSEEYCPTERTTNQLLKDSLAFAFWLDFSQIGCSPLTQTRTNA